MKSQQQFLPYQSVFNFIAQPSPFNMMDFRFLLIFLLITSTTLLSHLASGEAFHSTPKQSSPAPVRQTRAPLRVPVIKGRIPYTMPGDQSLNPQEAPENQDQQQGHTAPGPRDTTPPLTAVSAPPTNYAPSASSTNSLTSSPPFSSLNLPSTQPDTSYHSNPAPIPPPIQHQQQHQQHIQSYHEPKPIVQKPVDNFINNLINNNNHNHINNNNQPHHETIAPKIPASSAHQSVKVPSPASAPSIAPPLAANNNKKVQMNRFSLDELVNAIAQAAINGDIPFNKVDLRKPFKSQSLQIPILLLRPEDLYRATGTKINFKLITAQPIRIPIFDEPPAPFTPPQHQHSHHHSHHGGGGGNFNGFNNNMGPNNFVAAPQYGHREMRQMPFPVFNQNQNSNQNFGRNNNFNNNNNFVPNNNNNYVLFQNAGNSNVGKNVNFHPQKPQQHFQSQQPQQQPQQQFQQQKINFDSINNNNQINQNVNQNINKNYGKSAKSSKFDVLKVIPAPKLSKSNDAFSNQIDSSPSYRPSSSFDSSPSKSFSDNGIAQIQSHQSSSYQNGGRDGGFSGSSSNGFSNSGGYSSGNSVPSGFPPSISQKNILKQNTVTRTSTTSESSSSSSSSSSSYDSTGKKRTRPVIKIRPERPPVRINSSRAPIRVKPERAPKRMNPMVKKAENAPLEKYEESDSRQIPSTTTNNQNYQNQQQRQQTQNSQPEQLPEPQKSKSVIPERYLQDMPPYKSDEEIKAVPFPKFSQDESSDNSEQSTRNGNGNENYGYERNQINQQQNSANNNAEQYDERVNINAAFSKSSHAKQIQNQNQSPNPDFASVFRKPESSKSERYETQTTRTTSGNLEDLEKSGYDKQLVKTLKNLMATTAKRHKLNFEDDESSKTEKVSGGKGPIQGKIPDKYLQGSPIGNIDDRSSSGSGSGGTQFDDELGDEVSQNFQKNRVQQQPYQHYGGTGDQEAAGSSRGNGNGNSGTNYEQGQGFRVAGFDPNYEYLNSENSREVQGTGGRNQEGSSGDSYQGEGGGENLGEVSGLAPTEFVSEQVGPDGKKIKTYVMTGTYRQKIDEVVRNDANSGEQSDYHRAEESDPVPQVIAKVFEPSDASSSAISVSESPFAETQNFSGDDESFSSEILPSSSS